MNKSLALPITLLALGLLVLAGVLVSKPTDTALGSAFPGTAAFLQSATTTTVGPQAVPAKTLFSFESDGSCKSRVVTTPGTSAIMISFADPYLVTSTSTTGNISSTTLSASIGHLQAASTTQVYDSGLYGCGRMTAWAWATTTLTISEF